eukprot:5291918-Amphidinium_carterae.1
MVQKKGGGIADRYALKCVLKKPVVENNQTSMLINERSILTEIDHPFIVKLVQTFKNDAYVYFLLELVSGGELLEALQVLGLLNLEQAQFYSGSIVLALEHLHDRRVAYLDLKSENILIDYQGRLTPQKNTYANEPPLFPCEFGAVEVTSSLWTSALP